MNQNIINFANLTKKAFLFVRNKRKPLFLEYDTMRTCGHVGPENDDKEHNYRNKYLKIWSKKNTQDDFLNLLKKKFSIDKILLIFFLLFEVLRFLIFYYQIILFQKELSNHQFFYMEKIYFHTNLHLHFHQNFHAL